MSEIIWLFSLNSLQLVVQSLGQVSESPHLRVYLLSLLIDIAASPISELSHEHYVLDLSLQQLHLLLFGFHFHLIGLILLVGSFNLLFDVVELFHIPVDVLR